MAATVGFSYRLFLVCFVCLFSLRFCQDFKDKCKGKISNCYCTDFVIDCQGHEFSSINEIYPYITGLTFRISITDGKLEHIPSDLFGPVVDMIDADHLYNVTFLNFSGNGIREVGEGAFGHLPNLETLDLSDNGISVSPCRDNSLTNSLIRLPVLKELNLRNALCKDTVSSCDLGNIVGNLNMTRLKWLDLSDNAFSKAGVKFDTFMQNAFSLEHLNLSHNQFLHFVYGHGYENLVEYDFSYNQMNFLTNQETDEIESMPRLKIMKIGGNPIHCDCRMSVAYDWFNSTDQPLDFDNIICQYSDNATNIGKPIRSLRLEDFCEGPRVIICPGPHGPIAVARSTAWIILIAAAVLIVIAIASFVMVIRHRRKRRSDGNTTASRMENKSPAYSRMV